MGEESCESDISNEVRVNKCEDGATHEKMESKMNQPNKPNEPSMFVCISFGLARLPRVRCAWSIPRPDTGKIRPHMTHTTLLQMKRPYLVATGFPETQHDSKQLGG